MTFEEWWECNCGKPCPSNAKDAARVLFEAGQNYEREACVADCLKAAEVAVQMYGSGAECIATVDECLRVIDERGRRLCQIL